MKLVKEHIIFEKFEEESDPVLDMGMGLIDKISDGLMRLSKEYGVEFISLEKYFPYAWAVEVRYYNPHNRKGIINKMKECLGEELFTNIGTRLYGDYGKVIGAGLIKKEYQEYFDKVLDDLGNIKKF